jgi:hypothetical protein
MVGALRGEVARAWLAWPAIYYGGGYGLHLWSIHEAQLRIATIEADNASTYNVREPFSFSIDSYAPTTVFLQKFRIQAIYVGRNSAEPPFVSKDYIGDADECSRADPRSNTGPWRLNRFGDHADDTHPVGTQGKPACVLSVPHPTGDPEYAVDRLRFTDGPPSLPYYEDLQGWRVRDRKTGVIVGSRISRDLVPLAAVPFLFAGCGLNSGAAKYDCGAVWWTDKEMPVAPPIINSIPADAWDENALLTDLLSRSQIPLR